MTLVGENRSDALAAKQALFADSFTWDFIGHLQSRKVRDVVGRVRLIHAVDSLSVCAQIDSRASQPVDCLLQVNVAGEESKAGVAPDQSRPIPAAGSRVRERAVLRIDDDAAAGGAGE